MSRLTKHNEKTRPLDLHVDVYDNPEYVLRNPGCYTRDEVDMARRVLWTSSNRKDKTNASAT